MTAKESVETFCTDCGARVVMQFRRRDIGIDVVGCEPCQMTDKGTVYRSCPGCGDDVAVHLPDTLPEAFDVAASSG